MALINKLEAIGDAIREKTGGTEELTLEQMATAINGLSIGGGTLQTAVITSVVGYTYYLDNYVDVSAGDNFILFYTFKAKYGSDYIKAIHMPAFGKYIYSLTANTVNSDTNGEVNDGIESIGTTNVAEVNRAIAYQTNSTIDEERLNRGHIFFSSAEGCQLGDTAILVYVG